MDIRTLRKMLGSYPRGHAVKVLVAIDDCPTVIALDFSIIGEYPGENVVVIPAKISTKDITTVKKVRTIND